MQALKSCMPLPAQISLWVTKTPCRRLRHAKAGEAAAASSADSQRPTPHRFPPYPRAVCVFYATSAGALSLVNKVLLSGYAFDGVFSLLGAQLLAALLLLFGTKRLLGNPLGVPDVDAATLRLAAPMGLVYVANVTAGLAGLQLVNLPMFFCVRRMVPLCVLALEWALLRKVADPATQAAVAAVTLGAVVAGWETLSTDGLGYAITMLNNAW